jgi:hypothetical protein
VFPDGGHISPKHVEYSNVLTWSELLNDITAVHEDSDLNTNNTYHVRMLVYHSCKSVFVGLEILPLPCEFIFSLMNLVVTTKNIFRKIQLYTRNRNHLHRPRVGNPVANRHKW